MDTGSIIEELIIVVVGGLLLSFLIFIFTVTPISAIVGKIYKRLVRWGCQLVRWVRHILFETKTYCTRKRKLMAVCDVNLEDLDTVGIDTSTIVPQLGNSKRIEAGITITVYSKDAKKIKRLVCSRSTKEFVQITAPKDISMDLVVLRELRRIAVSDSSISDNEIAVPCFVDDIHPIVKLRKRLSTSKK